MDRHRHSASPEDPGCRARDGFGVTGAGSARALAASALLGPRGLRGASTLLPPSVSMLLCLACCISAARWHFYHVVNFLKVGNGSLY